MLAKDGNGTTNFEDGNENGWPARNRRKKKTVRHRHKSKTKDTTTKNTHHAIGNVINNDINWIKLNPMDFAPSDSSK